MTFIRVVFVVSAETKPSQKYFVFSKLSKDTVTSTAEYSFKCIHSSMRGRQGVWVQQASPGRKWGEGWG